MRFPDERSWHSVTKIYLILKISEELEALILSTEAPCHTPFSTRPAGNSPAAPLSQRPSHAALLCVRHFIPDGCAWCHRLFNCTCCRDILSTAWLLPPRLCDTSPDSAGLLLLPRRTARACAWELTGQQQPVRHCHSAKPCYQVPVICQYTLSLLRKVQQACWNKPQFKWPQWAY